MSDSGGSSEAARAVLLPRFHVRWAEAAGRQGSGDTIHHAANCQDMFNGIALLRSIVVLSGLDVSALCVLLDHVGSVDLPGTYVPGGHDVSSRLRAPCLSAGGMRGRETDTHR